MGRRKHQKSRKNALVGCKKRILAAVNKKIVRKSELKTKKSNAKYSKGLTDLRTKQKEVLSSRKGSCQSASQKRTRTLKPKSKSMTPRAKHMESLSDKSEIRFEVEQVVDEKVVNGQSLFFLKWKNYSSDLNTWESEEHLVNCKNLIDDYRRRAKNGSKTVKTPKLNKLRTSTVESRSKNNPRLLGRVGGTSIKNNSRLSAKINFASSSKVESRSASKVNSRSLIKVDSRSTSKVDSRTPSKVDSRSPSKVNSRSSSKVNAKSTSKVNSRSSSKVNSRSSIEGDLSTSVPLAPGNLKDSNNNALAHPSESSRVSDSGTSPQKNSRSSIKRNKVSKSVENRIGSRSSGRKTFDNLVNVNVEVDCSCISLSSSHSDTGEKQEEYVETESLLASELVDERSESLANRRRTRRTIRNDRNGISSSQNTFSQVCENNDSPVATLNPCDGSNAQPLADSSADISINLIRTSSGTSVVSIQNQFVQSHKTVDEVLENHDCPSVRLKPQDCSNVGPLSDSSANISINLIRIPSDTSSERLEEVESARNQIEQNEEMLNKARQKYNIPLIRLKPCDSSNTDSLADPSANLSINLIRITSDTLNDHITAVVPTQNPSTQNDTKGSEEDLAETSVQIRNNIRTNDSNISRSLGKVTLKMSPSRDAQDVFRKHISARCSTPAIVDENVSPNILTRELRCRPNAAVSSEKSQQKMERVIMNIRRNPYFVPEKIIDVKQERGELKFVVTLKNSNKEGIAHGVFLAKKYPHLLLNHFREKEIWRNYKDAS